MRTPLQVWEQWKSKVKEQWKVAFFSTIVIGLLIHMPILLSDIPNHDGLDSMYFDQNMITSGRWLLGLACGISSFFTIPWIIGLLGMIYLGLSAVVLTEVFEVRNKITVVFISGLLVSFPSLASTFAYVFTLDGYMLALLLAVSSVLVTKKYQKGYLAGGILLGCSLGIYQAYLPFAILLSICMVVKSFMGTNTFFGKCKEMLHYLLMGVLGVAFYYVMLKFLLWIQGKELASYQGINEAGKASFGLGEIIIKSYRDFLAFTVKGNVFFNNPFSLGAVLILLLAVLFTVLWLKKPLVFVIISILLFVLPVATNSILLISPGVTYHLLMRYQWVMFLVVAVVVIDKGLEKLETGEAIFVQWASVIATVILIFNYAVTDNIAYSNLQKKYEKTYSYCVRLLDRIEQTKGYYQGIPIAMIGVVGEEQFPSTDISKEVTSGMIGLSGDSLLYTGANYEAFMKYYLGASLHFVESKDMAEIYYSKEYTEMDSFPGENSVKFVNGMIYVKTENATRE